jgi:hypothetical protein
LEGLVISDILILLLIIGVGISYIYLLIWIWKDSQKWDEEPIAWTIGASMFWILVLPFYLSARGHNKTLCSKCNKAYPQNLPNCPHCGEAKKS